MNNTDEIYGSSYLSAQSVRSQELTGKNYKITSSVAEEFGPTQRKVVLGFENLDKELALNKTNATILADAWGKDFSLWVGKELQFMLTKVNYQGNLVDSVVVVPQSAGTTGQ